MNYQEVLDVKGINDNKLFLHEDYLIEFFKIGIISKSYIFKSIIGSHNGNCGIYCIFDLEFDL